MDIHVDVRLPEEAKVLGHHVTNEAAVNEALAECVRRRKQRRIADLFGKIDYDPEYDYKVERQAR